MRKRKLTSSQNQLVGRSTAVKLFLPRSSQCATMYASVREVTIFSSSAVLFIFRFRRINADRSRAEARESMTHKFTSPNGMRECGRGRKNWFQGN